MRAIMTEREGERRLTQLETRGTWSRLDKLGRYGRMYSGCVQLQIQSHTKCSVQLDSTDLIFHYL